MTLAFHQPNFLPNLGFFHKMRVADIFVIVTNIQFEKREGWQRRHKIVLQGKERWLTVPVHGSQNQRIKDVRIDTARPWQRKHMGTLEAAYRETSERELLTALLQVYARPWERLADLNVAFIQLLREILGNSASLVLDEEITGKKEQLILNICRQYGADTYLSGLGGRHYLTNERLAALEDGGVECRFVERDITGAFPYSTVHYLLTHGVPHVRTLL